MTDFDVFNGDADGICSLVQLRLAVPRQSELITGVKRDIGLLSKVNISEGDRVTVLDISMEKNQSDLLRLLEQGAQVFYADHHKAGDIPKHPNLTTCIDLKPTICTALIVNRYLDQRFPEWAITAAFGDNLEQSALKLAKQIALPESVITQLKTLGLYLNYNGYGATTDDLFFHPVELYQACVEFASPVNFVEHNPDKMAMLEVGYTSDMSLAKGLIPFHQTSQVVALMLPDEAWARRVHGVLGNALSNRFPDRAHAIFIPKDSGYQVSIRAPQNRLHGADEIASQFPSGGGRKGAAGINLMPDAELSRLIDLMSSYYSKSS